MFERTKPNLKKQLIMKVELIAKFITKTIDNRQFNHIKSATLVTEIYKC